MNRAARSGSTGFHVEPSTFRSEPTIAPSATDRKSRTFVDLTPVFAKTGVSSPHPRFASATASTDGSAPAIGPETRIARGYAYYPGATSGFGLGFAVRTSVPANTQWPLGEYRWDGVAGTFFFIDPEDDMFAIFMVQTPSQRGRIQLALKTLIYQAMGR